MGFLARARQRYALEKAVRSCVETFPDVKAMYWSSMGCCPTCDAADDGKWMLPFDFDLPSLDGPHPDCTSDEECTCSAVYILVSEMEAPDVKWTDWSAAYIAEHGHPLAKLHPDAALHDGPGYVTPS